MWRQACGDPHVAGAPDISGSLNRYACPGDRPLGLTTAFTRVLSRAYPRSSPGRLTHIRSDHRTGAFEFRGRPESGTACDIEAWVPGPAAPDLSAEGFDRIDARAVPGGWTVTGCARGAWVLRGEPGAGGSPADAAPAGRRCVSRRLITVTVRRRPRRVSVRIGGGRATRVRPRGRRIRLDLRGRPKGTVVVRITGRTRGGRRYAERRVYRLCVRRGARRR